MATKRKTEDVVEAIDGATSETAAAGAPETTTTAGAKPVSDYCCLVNLTTKAEQYSLTNGRTVTCGPKLKGRTTNRSTAVLRKHVGTYLRELEKEKRLLIDQATAEEVNA
jgi:hypothetical protein